jgi:hypothetical protein
MRSRRALPLAALLVLAAALVGRAADSTPEEAAYDAAVTGWQQEWAARPTTAIMEHAVCIRYWQTGDVIRSRMKAAPVPPSRAAYHTALLAYVDGALDAADECLAESRVTTAWMAKNREAGRLRQALWDVVRHSGLKLPTNWH